MQNRTNLRKLSLLVAISASCIIQSFSGEKPKDMQIPDIPGYYTLKCDFHMHTIFSDGKVWPTVRVAEALSEGLDAIALSDHIGKQKPDTDVIKNLNRAYDIAAEEASNSDLIVIKGAEITFPMPPGHMNALFLSDAEKLDTKEYMDAFNEAKKQDAFFFWNHSNWKSPDNKWEQNGIAQWFDVHTELMNKGMLMGLEVVNGPTYNLEAHRWCLEKDLAMFANTDIHQPITFEYELESGHRPLTLVFARDHSAESIKEALLDRRTAVWYEHNIIGREEFLLPLFQNSVSIEKVSYYEKIAEVVMKNNSDVDLILENIGDYSFFNKTRIFTLKAGEELRLGVKTGEVLQEFTLKFKVHNYHISPEKSLQAGIICKKNK